MSKKIISSLKQTETGQLALSDINRDNYKYPVQSPKLSGKTRQPKSPSVKEKETAPLKQGFLPGLSRRGRPRLAKPVSAVKRTIEHRRKRMDQGAKRLEVILSPDVRFALDSLAEQTKMNKSALISMLVLKAYATQKRREDRKKIKN
jgi:hypothetical protein